PAANRPLVRSQRRKRRPHPRNARNRRSETLSHGLRRLRRSLPRNLGNPWLVVIIGSVSGLILASTFYSWRFAYFWLDDFNNLFWVQQQSLARMLWYNVNPFANF